MTKSKTNPLCPGFDEVMKLAKTEDVSLCWLSSKRAPISSKFTHYT